MMNAIEINDLTVFLKLKSKKELLKIYENLNLIIPQGEWIYIEGINGIGKSLLLRLITNSVFKPERLTISGIIKIFGNQINNKVTNGQIPPEIAFVQQTDQLIHVFNFIENTMAPLLAKGVNYKVALAQATDLIENFNLSNLMYKGINELSGGQKRILSILMGLIQKPKILIFDEPFNNLDTEKRDIVRATLEKIRSIDENLTVLMISHDLFFDQFDEKYKLSNFSIKKYSEVNL